MAKKVLFLIPNLAHGGAERVLVNLANNLDKNKFEVTIQTLFDVGVNRQYINQCVRYIPGYKKQFPGNSHLMKIFSPKILFKCLIREKYDIIVSYLEGPTARIVAGCPNPNVKKIGWIHVELNTAKLAAVGFRSATEAIYAYNTYDRLIAVSQQVKKIFLQSLPVQTQMDVLYNTNETEVILKRGQEEVHDPNFVIDDVPSLCSVAKIIPTKGFDRLVVAHRRLLDEGLHHRIYILGIGEKQKELEKTIEELGVQNTFILLGFQENPYQYVSKCDCYVCSSRREGFSTAVTEALILGVPVVSTNCSGATELLGENNEYGIVVENSEEGIYQGLKRMLSEPGLIDYYRKQAEIRGTYFSREKTVAAVEKMMESL